MRRLMWFLGAACLSGPGAMAAEGPEARDGQVAAALVSESATVAPGRAFTVAVRLRMDKGWHTYWRNSGDSGFATAVDWKLPAGFVAGPLRWPAPERVMMGGIVSYGYHGERWLLAEMRPPADWAGSEAVIGAKVAWLMCQESCIPGEAEVQLRLPRGDGAEDAAMAADFAKARAAIPRVAGELGWTAAAERVAGDAKAMRLVLRQPAGSRPVQAAYFFPDTAGQLDHALPQPMTATGGAVAIELKVAPEVAQPPARLSGVAEAEFEGGTRAVFALEAEVLETAGRPAPMPSGAAGVPGDAFSLWMALAFAFLGGLVLNVMPCVLPVISLKVFSFMKQGGEKPGAVMAHSLVFSAGVMLSFLALAGLLLALRAAGQAVGWGFQFQSPQFVAAMCAMVFVLSLALFGVFVIGGSLMGAGQGLASGGGWTGSFFSGVLATTLATPCTAPFMGAALGFALAQPAGVTLAVFAALGAGMAAPYLLLATNPALLRFLPKPGAWMETFKQSTGFLMLGTVVWLLWVFGATRPSAQLVMLIAYLLLLALGCWIIGRFAAPPRGAASKAAAWVAALALAAGGWVWLVIPAAAGGRVGEIQVASGDGIRWQPYSPAALEEALGAGKPVFVDFTAEWCLSCKVNERVALETPSTRALFRERSVIALKADWTARDPQITRALESFGRSGVPLYVYYPPGRKDSPVVLPEVITAGIVRRAIEENGLEDL